LIGDFFFVEQKFIWSTIANIIPDIQSVIDLIHVCVTVFCGFATTGDVVIRCRLNTDFSLLL